MSTLTMKDLEAVLREFKESTCDGVPGVMKIDGPKPGPILGITACTHGNEPAGLAMFRCLLGELNIKETLQCGTLYLVVNNIAAVEDFFVATTEEQRFRARYKEVDMNRLPDDTPVSSDHRYEVARARALYPIWKRFTHGLDIHSTTADIKPMIISRGNNFERIAGLISGFPINILISNIDEVQINTPSFAFHGGVGNDVVVFGIEAGQHTKAETLQRAMDCGVSLLQKLGMYPGASVAGEQEYKEYEIAGSIMFRDMSFDFVQNFESFCTIREGDLLATNSTGEEMRAPFDGHLVMPTPKRKEDKDITHEVAFISRPVKIRRV